jgi:hypothetical protein
LNHDAKRMHTTCYVWAVREWVSRVFVRMHKRKDTYVLTVKYTKSSVGSGDGDDADMTVRRICRRLESGKCGGYK